jgi:hypothetical protein
MAFTPPEVPESPSGYAKLEQGENRFRILDTPLTGYVYWDVIDRKKTPVRSEERPEVGGKVKVNYFWAIPIWNESMHAIQVLEIVQKTIMRAINSLNADPDYGDPINYDIAVTKKGEGMDTKYTIMPKPAKPLSDEAKAEWIRVQNEGFDLTKMYHNESPFGKVDTEHAEEAEATAEDEQEEMEIDVEDVFPGAEVSDAMPEDFGKKE